jgi:hypothetical protein
MKDVLYCKFNRDEATKWLIMTNSAAMAVSREIQPPGKCTKRNAQTAVKIVKYRSNPPKANRYYAVTATGKRKASNRA